MRVNILVTIPDPELFDSCTLCFDTLRTGFPTSDIHVTLNGRPNLSASQWDSFNAKIKACGAGVHELDFLTHHARWIERMIRFDARHQPSEPCVLLDSDTVFWQSCEKWKFDTLLAGYYNPLIWNDFAQCVSFERLHTSLLWISDSKQLLEKINSAYPNATKPHGEYCPVNPFMPRVQFIKGIPFFWDSTAALYNMIGGTAFGEEHKACYDHLNSASFYKVMHERLENRQGFEFLHKHLVKTPAHLRGLWKVVDPYYSEKHRQALAFLNSAKVFGPPGLGPLMTVLQ